MNRWIALFRGINVGGKNVLPMKKLATDLAELKRHNIRTYIPSGNVVFDSKAKNASSLAKSIRSHVEVKHGFAPQDFILGVEDLQQAIDENPFPIATSDAKSLLLFFLERSPTNVSVEALDADKTSTENFRMSDGVFYLHPLDGIERSKLASAVEKHLGVATTTRNYRTVQKTLGVGIGMNRIVETNA
ncbi:DUF1697 domain-containing protein [Aureliella helgolandensis]|uniref:DUF1697 domain-containing protein n=1 Tax=Aureliella helgolandensis TaxID=2527968 RepID=A0A518G773_9BACT|nr:DUF1697 domain-containing protein [Aureliella helgolandensis]QDV24440.1 hypothetical protein Q31a_27580 [Aureliella helgolandensis]